MTTKTMAKKTAVPIKKAKKAMSTRHMWDPFGDLRKEFEGWSMPLLGRMPLMGRPFWMSGKNWMPSTDVYEEDGKLFVRADLPGLTKSDVEVSFENGDLVLTGERSHEKTEDKKNYYRTERAYGSFFERVPLPDGIDPDKAKATCKDGVLEVVMALPKEATSEAKTITVE